MTRQRGLVQDVEDSSENQADDVTNRIVSRIAARKGVEPELLTPPLYDAIEPESVTSLIENASADAPLTLEFRYANYQVRIDAAEQTEIDVTPI